MGMVGFWLGSWCTGKVLMIDLLHVVELTTTKIRFSRGSERVVNGYNGGINKTKKSNCFRFLASSQQLNTSVF